MTNEPEQSNNDVEPENVPIEDVLRLHEHVDRLDGRINHTNAVVLTVCTDFAHLLSRQQEELETQNRLIGLLLIATLLTLLVTIQCVARKDPHE